MSEVNISSGTRNWGSLSMESIYGQGRVSPRLALNFRQHPFFAADVELIDVTLRLEVSHELVGVTRLPRVILRQDAPLSVEFPTTHHMLRYATDSLGSGSTAIVFAATLHGEGRARLDPSRVPVGATRFMGEPELGEWGPITISTGTTSTLQVSRSEWFERVLAPCRGETYVYLELALPPDSTEWSTAIAHLRDAERCYALGDDPGVFLRLKAALDALPGAKQRILDDITDAAKQKAMDDLIRKIGAFLHAGRHVSESGDEAGVFPVDHLDAAFALDTVRVALAHLSLLLAANQRRTAARRGDS
ncbi:MAG: hypothetical protein ACRENY_08640 [Candidatus Dormibacteria bacterium]